MIEADKKVNDYVTSLKGLYRRYSDDFIVIVPKKNNEVSILQGVIDIIKEIPILQLKPKKTQVFSVEENIVKNIGNRLLYDANTSKQVINFLGFSFDGKQVSIRAKTISKYYYRMYRKAKSIANNPNSEGADNLYRSSRCWSC